MGLFMAVFAFTACGDDDNNGGGASGGGSATATIGGKSATFSYGFWSCSRDSFNHTYLCELEFCTFDMLSVLQSIESGVDIISKIPSSFSTLTISFPSSNNIQYLGSMTIRAGYYTVAGALNMSSTYNEGEYCFKEASNKKNGDLVITKNGNSYTVTIEPLYYMYSKPSDGYNATWKTTEATSFKYTGSLPNPYSESTGGDNETWPEGAPVPTTGQH